MSFSGQRALVTGATSGIGYALAESLAAEGMDLHLLARNAQRLEATRETLRARFPDCTVDTHSIDLGMSAADLSVALGEIEDQNLSVLVHSAGAYSATNILSQSAAEVESMFRVNASSLLTLAQRFMDALVRNSGGLVVINSSAAAQPAKANTGAYAASKSAARALTDALRDEVNAKGVRVLSVLPGRTATPMQAAIYAAEGRDYPADSLLQSQDIASVVMNALKLPRTAEVTEIAVRPFQKT